VEEGEIVMRIKPPPYKKGTGPPDWNRPGIYRTKKARCKCGAWVTVFADVTGKFRCPYCCVRDVDFTEVQAEEV
jgi:hypothetical protein